MGRQFILNFKQMFQIQQYDTYLPFRFRLVFMSENISEVNPILNSQKIQYSQRILEVLTTICQKDASIWRTCHSGEFDIQEF